MSPVNALRWVLRAALGAELPMLRTRSFFSSNTKPYEFTEMRPDELQGAFR
jgi:hypothetical protein